MGIWGGGFSWDLPCQERCSLTLQGNSQVPIPGMTCNRFTWSSTPNSVATMTSSSLVTPSTQMSQDARGHLFTRVQTLVALNRRFGIDNLNIFETTPIPNKSGSYGIKSWFVRHCESPSILQKGKRFLRDTSPHLMGSFGAPSPGLFLAKYSAGKANYIDVSQPPHQGDELNRHQIDTSRTPNGRQTDASRR